MSRMISLLCAGGLYKGTLALNKSLLKINELLIK